MAFALVPEVEALARQRAGVVTRRQLLDRGVSYAVIRRRLDVGHWMRSEYPGVYITYTGPLRLETEVWAALSCAGQGAALSHETAAMWWQIAEVPQLVRPIHLTLPDHRRIRGRPGLRLHYSRDLERRIHPARTVPVTRVQDTILDLIDAAGSFERVVDWVTRACRHGRTTAELLRTAAAERARLRWRKDLAGLLGDVAEGVRSALELAYLRRVERAHGLPVGHRQQRRFVPTGSQWIDVEYARFRLIVELDGRLGHDGAERFRDHRRDNVSTLRGFDTLRYGWADTVLRGCQVASEVGAMLARNGWSGSGIRCGEACTFQLGP